VTNSYGNSFRAAGSPRVFPGWRPREFHGVLRRSTSGPAISLCRGLRKSSEHSRSRALTPPPVAIGEDNAGWRRKNGVHLGKGERQTSPAAAAFESSPELLRSGHHGADSTHSRTKGLRKPIRPRRSDNTILYIPCNFSSSRRSATLVSVCSDFDQKPSGQPSDADPMFWSKSLQTLTKSC